MKAYEFAFAIGDAVTVKAINRPARVDGVLMDICGPQFRIVFWAEGKRESVVVYEWELEAQKAVE